MGEANEIETDATGTSALNGFEDQDLFASNKAKEAFSVPMSDPFGSAFPAQQSNVSSFYGHVYVCALFSSASYIRHSLLRYSFISLHMHNYVDDAR